MNNPSILFPKAGKTKEELLATMRAARQNDVNWREAKTFSLVFNAGEEIINLLKEAYTLFFSENGLNPTAFPSLRKFETEVVCMVADLLGGKGQIAGNLTSGGTESILMAVKTARDWSRAMRPEIHAPEMILPLSAHPAFEKAAHYFGVKPVHTALRPDFRANVDAVEAAINPQTILVVGSAPSYPQGVVDPIPELAKVAQEHDLLFHVDACVGGLMLPFVRRLGYPVPDFDFSVPGVTSISADLHKYGYAAKGSSLILYQSSTLRRYQFFAYSDWSGGIYVSPSMTGTRPGGAIAASWAILNYLGEDGYLSINDTVMRTTRKIQDGIADIPMIKVLSDPEMSVFAIASDELDIYQVGDELTSRGWHLDRQQFPASLHMTVNYAHHAVADEFLQVLAESVKSVRKPSLRKLGNRLAVRLAMTATRLLPEKTVSHLTSRAANLVGGSGSGLPSRSAPLYGLIGSLPNRGDINELVLDMLDRLTRPEE